MFSFREKNFIGGIIIYYINKCKHKIIIHQLRNRFQLEVMYNSMLKY